MFVKKTFLCAYILYSLFRALQAIEEIIIIIFFFFTLKASKDAGPLKIFG